MNNTNNPYFFPGYYYDDPLRTLIIDPINYPYSTRRSEFINNIINSTPRNKKNIVKIERKIDFRGFWEYKLFYKKNFEYIFALKAVKLNNQFRILSFNDTYLACIRKNKKKRDFALYDSEGDVYLVSITKNVDGNLNMIAYYRVGERKEELSRLLQNGKFEKLYVIMCDNVRRKKVLDLKMYFPLTKSNAILEVVESMKEDVVVEYKNPLNIRDVLFFIVCLWD